MEQPPQSLPFQPPEALHRAPPRERARTGGRVTALASGHMHLRGATATIEVELAAGTSRPAPYALVEAVGRWDGARLVEAELRVVGGPLGAEPTADGDFRFLQAHQGRRATALTERARMLATIRGYFDREGFLEVDTPTMVPSPGLDLHLAGFEVPPDRYLVTSPEYQMKRLLSAGFTRIYQLGRSYRQEEVGRHHEPEFTMLEWYRGFAGAEEVMQDTERMVAEVARARLGGTRLPPRQGRIIDVAPSWERLTVAEAFERYAGRRLEAVVDDEERFFRCLVDEIEPALGWERPVFLTRWPASMASLARLCPDDPRFADRFEVYVGGLELCNGFGELVDVAEQRQRLERDRAARREAGLPVYPLDERFLAALGDGVPPSGGNALGVDRLVLLLTGAEQLEDVVWLPSARL